MKIAWVNPTFLDYRIPLYDELNKLSNGEFYLLFSDSRVPQRCRDAVSRILGPNAHGITDKSHRFGSRNFANKYLVVTVPSGIGKALREINPDIIIVEGFFQYTPAALWANRKLKKPVFLAYERTAHTERNCPKPRLAYRKFITRFIDGYIANGQLTKEYLVSWGIDPNTVFTGGMCADSKGLAENCRNFPDAEKNQLRRDLNLSPGLTYLFVGRLIPLKGIGYLIDAWKKHILSHPDDNLLLVGDGPLRAEFEASAAQTTGLKLLGAVDYSHIYKYYAISDIFIIPTLEDNWSLVVPEAMACGLPIACSIYNGCYPELVKPGQNGTLFDPLRQSTIIEALEYFHHADLPAHSLHSLHLESHFSPAQTATKILTAITTTLQTCKSPKT